MYIKNSTSSLSNFISFISRLSLKSPGCRFPLDISLVYKSPYKKSLRQNTYIEQKSSKCKFCVQSYFR